MRLFKNVSTMSFRDQQLEFRECYESSERELESWVKDSVDVKDQASAHDALKKQKHTGTLEIWHLSIKAMPPFSSAYFPKLTSIEIRVGNLTEIKFRPQDAQALEKVRSLEISANRLAHVDPLAFMAMGNLQELALQNNRLTALPSTVFSRTPHLKTINLSGNQIAHFAPSLVSELKELSVLDLTNNKLTSLSRELVENLPQGCFLNLNGNPLDEKTVYMLIAVMRTRPDLQIEFDISPVQASYRHLSKVVNHPDNLCANVRLEDSDLASVPDMRDMTFVHTIDLSRNHLLEIPSGAFEGMAILKKLTFQENRLTYVSATAFAGLPMLANLDLSCNRLDHFAPDLFKGLPLLQKLDLHSNQLRSLPRAFFESIADGCEINLERNPLDQETLALIEELNGSGRLRIFYDMAVTPGRPAEDLSFEESAEKYLGLTLTDSARRFWSEPSYDLFKGWVCDTSLMQLKTTRGEDEFRQSLKEILALFRSSEPFRTFALSVIFDPEGCGDRKAIIFALLKTAVSLYDASAETCSFNELDKRYQKAEAVRQIIVTVKSRRLSGDESGQIAQALYSLNDCFDLGLEGLAMCHARTGRPILAFVESIGRDVAEKLSKRQYFEQLFELPALSKAKETFAEIKAVVVSERDLAVGSLEDAREKDAAAAAAAASSDVAGPGPGPGAQAASLDLQMLPDQDYHAQLSAIQSTADDALVARVLDRFATQ